MYGYSVDSKFDQYDFKTSNELRLKSRLIKSARPVSSYESVPRSCYTNRLSIATQKYKDLATLCNKGIIPKRFREEFLNLPHESSVRDELPETDKEDE